MDFPTVECERLHPTLQVPDVAAAVDFYTNNLGFRIGFTWPDDAAAPTMAGVTLGDVQVFSRQGVPKPRWHLGVLRRRQRGRALRIPSRERRGDRGGTRRPARTNCAITRARSARLPARLRALSYTVGRRSRSSASMCRASRETPGGAAARSRRVQAHEPEELPGRDPAPHQRAAWRRGASPHTKSQLRYIQELKKKHGIDYDSHGSYRFVEK